MLLDCAIARFHDDSDSSFEALSRLADQFVEAGIVQPDFFMKIWERENRFPTGLISEDMASGFAIPHTDARYVLKDQIGFMSLEKPVRFHLMTDPAREIDVRIIMMLAIKDPQTNVSALSGIMTVMSDPEQYDKLLEVSDFASLLSILSPYMETQGA